MVKVNLSPIVSLSSQQFKQICFANLEAKLELTAQRNSLERIVRKQLKIKY